MMRRFLKAWWAVTRHEVRHRRLAIAAAALLGVAPYLAPLLPFAMNLPPDELRSGITIVVLLCYLLGLLFFLGAGLLSRELFEGRLSFYYTRPIPTGALWFGKLSGALVVLVASILLITLPQMLEHYDDPMPSNVSWPVVISTTQAGWVTAFYDEGRPRLGTPGLILIILGGLITVVLQLHVLTVLVRRRDGWLFLDIVGLYVVFMVLGSARERLLAFQAIGPLSWVEISLFAWVLMALVTAGYVQLADGRTDTGRSRRRLSAVLWPLLALGAFAVEGYSIYSVEPEVDDLVDRQVLDLPAPHWVFVAGTTRHQGGYRAAFAQNVETGRSLLLGPLRATRFWLSTAENSRLIWPRCYDSGQWRSSCELFTVDLDGGSSEPEPTGITLEFRAFSDDLELSPDGRYAALIGFEHVTVHNVENGRLVFAAKQPILGLEYLKGERAWVFRRGSEAAVEVLLLDLQSGALEKRADIDIGRRPYSIQDAIVSTARTRRKAMERGRSLAYRLRAGSGVPLLAVHPTTGHLLYRHYSGQVVFHDLVSGTELSEHVLPWNEGYLYFLADGRTVMAGLQEGALFLTVLSAMGEIEQQVVLPGQELRFGKEYAPGRLLLALQPEKVVEGLEVYADPLPGWTLYELDIASGEWVPKIAGLVPLPALDRRRSGGMHLFQAGRGSVVEWDPASGKYGVVLEALEDL